MNRAFEPTEEQQKILDIEKGRHLVLAPPGSGKTELLAQRVFNAKEKGIKDEEMICLTFTNRAAKGMKERVGTKYPENAVVIGNIHHFCTLFLKENKLISPNASILDEEEVDQLIEELKIQYDYPPDKMRGDGSVELDSNGRPIKESVFNPNLLLLATYFTQLELGFPETLFFKPKKSAIPEPFQAKKLCEAYIQEKKNNNYLDFDDLLTLTYHHLTHSNGKDLKMAKFKWIQVDEVQDLNPLQWAILNEIESKDALTVYFGDYEQAIFSFMGAKLEFLHELEAKCEVHNLVRNFRSPSYLMDVYIDYSRSHFNPQWKKTPFAHHTIEKPKGALKAFTVNGNIYAESLFISENLIPNLPAEEKTAIVVRYNKTADIISKGLTQQGIAHFKISGFDFFRKSSVKGLMAFYSVLMDKYDRIAWARVFYVFKIIPTLKECRDFINVLTATHLTPIDLIKYGGMSSLLLHFFDGYSNREMIVFDTETTGLDIENDDIIQIAAMKIKNGVVIDEFEVYINTDKDLGEAEEVHKISKDKLLEVGVEHEEGLMAFMEFIGKDAVLVAHNIAYDKSILTANLERFTSVSLEEYCETFFDTIEIAQLIHRELPRYKLEYLLEVLEVEGVNSHNALDDVKATVSLIERLHLDFQPIQVEQQAFLAMVETQRLTNRLTERFQEFYTVIEGQLDEPRTLEEAFRLYFEEYKKVFYPKSAVKGARWLEAWRKEMAEMEKLFQHAASYKIDQTKADKNVTMREQLYRYLPDYRMYKESDLYLGEEPVLIATVYKAKGLEFDNVIVAEAVDETYPALWAVKNASPAVQEARKLEDARAFYVAMTRSKKRLYVTSHNSTPWGHAKFQTPFMDCVLKHFEEIEV